MQRTYHVKAIWGPEASVWISETDIPGLMIETDTLAEFQDLMETLATEMLAENSGIQVVTADREMLQSRVFGRVAK